MLANPSGAVKPRRNAAVNLARLSEHAAGVEDARPGRWLTRTPEQNPVCELGCSLRPAVMMTASATPAGRAIMKPERRVTCPGCAYAGGRWCRPGRS